MHWTLDSLQFFFSCPRHGGVEGRQEGRGLKPRLSNVLKVVIEPLYWSAVVTLGINFIIQSLVRSTDELSWAFNSIKIASHTFHHSSTTTEREREKIASSGRFFSIFYYRILCAPPCRAIIKWRTKLHSVEYIRLCHFQISVCFNIVRALD